MDAIANAPELDRRFGIRGIAKVCEGNGGLTVVKDHCPPRRGRDIPARGTRDILEARWER